MTSISGQWLSWISPCLEDGSVRVRRPGRWLRLRKPGWIRTTRRRAGASRSPCTWSSALKEKGQSLCCTAMYAVASLAVNGNANEQMISTRLLNLRSKPCQRMASSLRRCLCLLVDLRPQLILNSRRRAATLDKGILNRLPTDKRTVDLRRQDMARQIRRPIWPRRRSSSVK